MIETDIADLPIGHMHVINKPAKYNKSHMDLRFQ